MRLDKVFIGIMLIFIGFSLFMLSTAKIENVRYGGVVIIGPFPIIFGSSIDMAIIGLLIAVIMILILLALMR